MVRLMDLRQAIKLMNFLTGRLELSILDADDSATFFDRLEDLNQLDLIFLGWVRFKFHM